MISYPLENVPQFIKAAQGDGLLRDVRDIADAHWQKITTNVCNIKDFFEDPPYGLGRRVQLGAIALQLVILHMLLSLPQSNQISLPDLKPQI